MIENPMEQQTPKDWTPAVWHAFNKKMEEMSREALLKAFEDLDLVFEEPEELTKDDIISVADALSETDVKAYFKL